MSFKIRIYNFFIRLIAAFIPFRSKRKEFRNRFKIVPKPKTHLGIGSNKIICVHNGIEKCVDPSYFNGLEIQISGDNNVIKIHEPYCFENCKIIMDGENNLFEFKGTIYAIRETLFNISFSMNNRKVLIEKDCYIGGAVLLSNLSNTTLKIGEDCMFSAGIHIRTDDGHVICKKGTKDVINKGGDVTIGNHVWICRNVFINKKVSIGDNCIVASGAVMVKGSADTNVIWGGVPAKIIKRDIDWYRDGYDDFIMKQADKKR